MKNIFVKTPKLVVFTIMLLGSTLLSGQSAIPTFHSMGLYWQPKGGDSTLICSVTYRAQGQSTWKQGLDLWFDYRNKEYRGSLVHLQPNTTYDIKLVLSNKLDSAMLTGTTWSEDFPISDTVYLPSFSNQTYVLPKGGTSSGYVLYTFAPNDSAVIDVANTKAHCVEIPANTDYVIIRGLKLRGAINHGIRIYDNCNDVVIEKCDISNWGSTDQSGWGRDYESAVYSYASGVERVIIQCNKMHDPRTDANSWAEKRFWANDTTYHPVGAQAVSMFDSKGNHVIRYNEVFSDENHHFNDIFGGGSNYSFKGFPNRDSDIYGNKISHCWDDGIESEGANMNVRIWDNYIDHTYVKIAIAATSKGPIYIWRNIAASSRKDGTKNTSDDYGRGPFIKCGGKTINNVWYGEGKTYVFHNTILQPKPPKGQTYSLGCSHGVSTSGGTLYNMESRNNIFTTYKNWWPILNLDDTVISCYSDFNYDLFNGYVFNDCYLKPHEQKGIKLAGAQMPVYDPANGPYQYNLQAGALGVDAGVYIPNFSDGYTGKAPDMGAGEVGWPAMQIGTGACPVVSTGIHRAIHVDDYVSIYPNPSNGVFTVSIQGGSKAKLAEVYNLVGEKVWSSTSPFRKSDIDLTQLPAGVYMLRLYAYEGIQGYKLIKH